MWENFKSLDRNESLEFNEINSKGNEVRTKKDIEVLVCKGKKKKKKKLKGSSLTDREDP